MIKIDFSLAITLFLSFSIIIVFIFWLPYNGHDTEGLDNARWLRQCPYCTYAFFYYPNKEEGGQEAGGKLLKCPHCKSYIAV